jgi:hypothetical protein
MDAGQKKISAAIAADAIAVGAAMLAIVMARSAHRLASFATSTAAHARFMPEFGSETEQAQRLRPLTPSAWSITRRF